SDIPIHSSCNASQTMQIKRGLFDSKRLAREAADHILLSGNTSDLFQTYFGAQADPAVPLGIYERILEGDKTGTLLRCDDPDQNCATQDGWNGHWRGNNATEETVICNLSFQSRLGLERACENGFKLGRDNVNVYWGADLLHRMMHLPKVTNGYITHVADTHEDMMKIAIEQPDQSVKNQHSIQEFAFDVWTRKYISAEGSAGATATESASASAAATSTAAVQDCHTHADGSVHC
ncbi:zincin, partial [Meira miltonrushii]